MAVSKALCAVSALYTCAPKTYTPLTSFKATTAGWFLQSNNTHIVYCVSVVILDGQ